MNRPWLQSYPAGVPAEIDLSAYSSILDIFDQSCTAFRERTAYINFDRGLSYGDLDRHGDRGRYSNTNADAGAN